MTSWFKYYLLTINSAITLDIIAVYIEVYSVTASHLLAHFFIAHRAPAADPTAASLIKIKA